jgi:hypothetical protein
MNTAPTIGFSRCAAGFETWLGQNWQVLDPLYVPALREEYSSFEDFALEVFFELDILFPSPAVSTAVNTTNSHNED